MHSLIHSFTPPRSRNPPHTPFAINQAAYAKAGGVAEEVISSMRTVQAFGGEEREAARFQVSVEEAMKTGIKGGHINGISMGVTMLIMFSAYAIGFGYGAARVRAGAIEAGDVISTFFSIIIGSFALGQGAPNFAAVAKAKGAAYEVFGVIDRVSEIDPLDPSGEKPENGLQVCRWCWCCWCWCCWYVLGGGCGCAF